MKKKKIMFLIEKVDELILGEVFLRRQPTSGYLFVNMLWAVFMTISIEPPLQIFPFTSLRNINFGDMKKVWTNESRYTLNICLFSINA